MDKCVEGHEDQRDLHLMIDEADRRFLHSLKTSVVHFGLADHDEKECGILSKSANYFLFERNCINFANYD